MAKKPKVSTEHPIPLFIIDGPKLTHGSMNEAVDLS